jgi:hypothetical protein
MGRSAGGDPAPGPEVLLRWRQLPAEDLHRAATWHGGALRPAQLPIERSSPLAVTLALGGRAGARLARRLGLLACRSTLLRSLRHRMRPTAVTAPRVLGIDDWAWRKAHRYGTILCDLEAGKVVDLLPDREAATVAAWLQDHPGTEIVSRDRASAMPRPHAEPLRKPSRSPIDGTLCAT